MGLEVNDSHQETSDNIEYLLAFCLKVDSIVVHQMSFFELLEEHLNVGDDISIGELTILGDVVVVVEPDDILRPEDGEYLHIEVAVCESV